jgi:hypothetical protein
VASLYDLGDSTVRVAGDQRAVPYCSRAFGLDLVTCSGEKDLPLGTWESLCTAVNIGGSHCNNRVYQVNDN